MLHREHEGKSMSFSFPLWLFRRDEHHFCIQIDYNPDHFIFSGFSFLTSDHIPNKKITKNNFASGEKWKQ